jgi:solute:Na+ symporter, SSS family
VLMPFALLIGVSLLTRPPSKDRVDQFFGRMKTPVGATPLLENAAIEETKLNPGRFDHTKLFPGSSWEFTKWDQVDAIGFAICCAVSLSIIGLFWWLLRLAGPVV